MSQLGDAIRVMLLPGMGWSVVFEQLFNWIEEQGHYVDTELGRVGFLFPEDELKAGWTETERPGGTQIEFAASGNGNVRYWFGHEQPDVMNRLSVFAQTGAEGSEAAFWLDDDGRQVIVHMGSGSGSTLCCVLADDPVDFLRLLAIGYDEICWDEEFAAPPNASGEFVVKPNTAFREWVTQTFDVTIPRTALEIVKHPARLGDVESPDAFCCWVGRNQDGDRGGW